MKSTMTSLTNEAFVTPYAQEMLSRFKYVAFYQSDETVVILSAVDADSSKYNKAQVFFTGPDHDITAIAQWLEAFMARRPGAKMLVHGVKGLKKSSQITPTIKGRWFRQP